MDELRRPGAQSTLLLREFCNEALDLAVNPDANPGYPFSIYGLDSRSCMERARERLISAAVDRLTRLASSDAIRQFGAAELVRLQLVDPVRLFQKNEPHKRSKIASSRFRLISNVSLVDQLIDRILYGSQNEKEILNYTSHPSKPGMGLHDEGIQKLLQGIQEAKNTIPGFQLADADFSAWDWSVAGWEIMLDAEVRIRLYGLCDDDPVSRAIRNRHWCVANAVFVDSEGVMYAQKIPGIMKSGWYNTSSTNSRIVTNIAKSSNFDILPWNNSMGDDLLMQHVDNFAVHAARYGHIVKMYNKVETDDFEFCSHRFVNGTAYPLNVGKMIYKLLTNKTKSELERMALFEQFLFNIRHREDFSEIAYGVGHAFFLPVNSIGSVGVIDQTPDSVIRTSRKGLTRMPRDYTAHPIPHLTPYVRSATGSPQMYSPVVVDGIQYTTRLDSVYENMPDAITSTTKPNKKKKNRNKKKKNPANAAQAVVNTANKALAEVRKEASLGRKILQGIGYVGGRVLGGDPGANAGYSLANSVATFLGLGDYKVRVNSLVTNGVPAMHKTSQDVIVRHREYIADVVSSGTANGFTSTGYSINPGVAATFPWLSTLASMYQEYEFRGLVFEFVSTSADAIASSTNTTLGSVIMATLYRNSLGPFTNKQQMLNEFFSNDGKPSLSFCHPIECDPKENPYQIQYVRTQGVPSGEDVKTYDLGTFYIASQGIQGTGVVLGELWATYEVVLRKPLLYNTPGQSLMLAAHYSYSGTNFTSSATKVMDNIGMTVGNDSITFPIGTFGQFMLIWFAKGTAGSVSPMTLTGVNGAYTLGSTSNTSIATTAITGTNSDTQLQICWVNLQPQPGQGPYVTVAGGAIPASASCSVQVFGLPSNYS